MSYFLWWILNGFIKKMHFFAKHRGRKKSFRKFVHQIGDTLFFFIANHYDSKRIRAKLEELLPHDSFLRLFDPSTENDLLLNATPPFLEALRDENECLCTPNEVRPQNISYTIIFLGSFN